MEYLQKHQDGIRELALQCPSHNSNIKSYEIKKKKRECDNRTYCPSVYRNKNILYFGAKKMVRYFILELRKESSKRIPSYMCIPFYNDPVFHVHPILHCSCPVLIPSQLIFGLILVNYWQCVGF